MNSRSVKNVYRKAIYLCFTLILFKFNVLFAQNDLHLTKHQWLEDLNFVKKMLIENHPDIYYRISKEQFDQMVTRAEEKIRNSRTDEECLTAIRRVVASISDGHTMLAANNLPGYRNIFPVRLYEFSDGIFITGIAQKYAEYVGSKVLKIGKFSAEEAFRIAGSLAFADNEFSRKNQAPMIVINGKFAFGLGITESNEKITLVVETEKGSNEKIVLHSVTPPGANNMLRSMDIGPSGIPFVSAFSGTGKEVPLYLKYFDVNHNYWFTHDKEHKALYFQFNRVVNQGESIEGFLSRMFKYIDDNIEAVDKFILDLRFNDGGNGLVVLRFLNEIIKRDKINRYGHLFTIMGRQSFSAAVLLIAEMMHHTQVLLVGEPAGAAQNMFSDIVNRGTLPNCGAAIFVSSEYFNIAWPANENYIVPPHYPAPLSSEDFFSGIDPALKAIYADRVKPVEQVLREEGVRSALNYVNEIIYDWGVHTNEMKINPFTFPVSAKYKNYENDINDLGDRFMDQNKIDDARAAFELNTKLFPNSFNTWYNYAEYFMKNGDKSSAVKYFRKSLELNPGNDNAAKMIFQLENKEK